ncbi:N-acetyl sugar amidotransferase [Mesorhizobium sp. Z1-4]|uniref:N-acetyl sugar amidotransferase n=1 Tax=Mesorhizobium sp. Z1-4 TaxID=2448478 RepID=UPI000FDB4C99|nr:N-acetyl sugar amidotransferase [Mesorhizobium sp. Z1-4]
MSQINGPKQAARIARPGHNRRMCAMTIFDDTAPGISFDEDGVCNFARKSLWRLEHEVFHGEDGRQRLDALVARIKAEGRGRDYDCLIGLSGGVDSSFVAARVVELGLRPLAIHLDNGWNTDTAVSNIERLVKRLGIDLMTHVVDWGEIKDLQRAYIRASLLDLECVSDHAINTIMFRTAYDMRIGTVIHGGNVATESTMPAAWAYDKRDGVNLRAVHRAFGSVPLKSYPYMMPWQFFNYLFIRRIKTLPILNYLDYNKTEAVEEMKALFDWRPYPRKHGENRFTRFFQEYYLPRKFGIDKRVGHYSSLIVAGEMTRDDALRKIAEPLYEGNEAREELEYVAKKLGFSADELEALIMAPPRAHTEFRNAQWMFNQSSLPVQIARYIAKGEFSLSKLSTIRQAGR